jgi:hypothetical protein
MAIASRLNRSSNPPFFTPKKTRNYTDDSEGGGILLNISHPSLPKLAKQGLTSCVDGPLNSIEREAFFIRVWSSTWGSFVFIHSFHIYSAPTESPFSAAKPQPVHVSPGVYK